VSSCSRALEAELSQLKPFPARVNVETSEGDAFERLSDILNELRRDRAQMAVLRQNYCAAVRWPSRLSRELIA
jgi:hypothetical protein